MIGNDKQSVVLDHTLITLDKKLLKPTGNKCVRRLVLVPVPRVLNLTKSRLTNVRLWPPPSLNTSNIPTLGYNMKLPQSKTINDEDSTCSPFEDTHRSKVSDRDLNIYTSCLMFGVPETINPLVTNGLSHPIQLDESTFI